jgi:bifunctional NMN adenylyltransferase/nudix hydrolase
LSGEVLPDHVHLNILPLNDYKYSDSQWCSDVVETVKTVVEDYREEDITLVGHMKRGNSYLKYFPQWKYLEIPTTQEINATAIREQLLLSGSPLMPQSVKDDWKYFLSERKTFENYPFKATLGFMCGDVILECAGNILLIQRGRSPGQGTWALPGGFRNADETFLDCALRELMEETNVRVPEKVLRGNIVGTRLFDAVDRGCGIPRTTVAIHIRIEPQPDGSLPRANGADDAMECKWVPVADVMNLYKLFDDHKDIIQIMTGATPIMAINNPFI